MPDDVRQKQSEILARAQARIDCGEVLGEVRQDIEYFLIEVPRKGGTVITEFIPKNSGEIPFKKSGDMPATIEEAVEAVQRFFPEMEKPSLLEAVRKLRSRKTNY